MRLYSIVVLTLLGAASSSCSTAPPVLAEQSTVAYVGTVYAKPSIFSLDAKLNPQDPAEVFAEVTDLRATVMNVTLQFDQIPISVPMERVGWTRWYAHIPAEQLKQLAVNGKTISYTAKIIAENTEGEKIVSARPLYITVKTQEAKATG